jgi:hypothetical protein
MAITNYSELKTSAATWLHRNDLTASIPDFITMAEWRMARDLRISQLLATTNLTVSAGGNTASLPTGFLSLVNVAIAGGAELQYVPPDTIDRLSGSGVPWVYTMLGSNIQVAPTWTAGGNLATTYFKKETALSDANATNWYILNAPDTLLYATLLEAAPYLMNDNRIEIWDKYYQRGMAAINAQYGNIDPHKRMLQYSDAQFNGGRVSAGA